MRKIKKAFSLIEVIFVLVILGIVASISSQIIVQVYGNYITQKALYKTTTKTEMAINQIVNRLTFAIEGTTISKDPLNPPYTIASKETNWIYLKSIDITQPGFNRFTAIEWIGYDNDSFSAGQTPYWSGLANYETATKNGFETPGSRFNLVNTIINNLSNGKITLNAGGNLPAVLFAGRNYLDGDVAAGVNEIPHDPACMGLINPAITTCISRVQLDPLNDTRLIFPDAQQKRITERYKLAWSAYALVPEESTTNPGLFDLNLYSNYQPWNGETYQDGTKNLLINNVSVFKFTENGGVIQLKLCATENIGQDYNISSCKEKAIIQ